MATINLKIDTDATKDFKIAKFLDNLNKQRVKNGQTPYNKVDDVLLEWAISAVNNIANTTFDDEIKEVISKYRESTPAVQDQIKTLLNI